MIAYIKGILLDARDNACVALTASGLGYEARLPAHTFLELPPPGSPVEFYIWTVFRENAQELYGFASAEERETFGLLLSITKVGARTALAMLSLYRPEDLRAIAAAGDAQALARISGVGQKSAQRILLELRDKLGEKRRGPRAAKTAPSGGVMGDALAALANLGYDESECADLVREALRDEPDLDVASLIRATLKRLAKRKD